MWKWFAKKEKERGGEEKKKKKKKKKRGEKGIKKKGRPKEIGSVINTYLKLRAKPCCDILSLY